MRTIGIGGRYFRVADEKWDDPVDASYAAVGNGSRWNPPGLPCLYLNHDRNTAQANIRRKVGIHPFAIYLDPDASPVIVDVDVPDGTAADAFTQEGIQALGLPATYPWDAAGTMVSHQQCQPVGQSVFDAELDGIDCRSAAEDGNRELAWFPRGRQAHVVSRQMIDQWWVP
ncbi:RES family NAD+ phosphorylase [Candidatus Poriferisodalis sp.]|uniref:RES family NAD+ phosphorylase n=1 Tax=Candidatus Poriferisodalis sp. TaxID=3101277 RepID=UPI003B5C67E8